MAPSGRPAMITSLDFAGKAGASQQTEATRRPEPEAAADTAHYVAQLSGEMAVLARSARLDVLAYFLDMAKLEAEAARRVGARV
jgi:hypothetical protein